MSWAMKDSGIPWIGDIPCHWETCTIKQVMRNKSVKGFPDEQVLSLYRDFGVVPKESRDDNHNVTSDDTSGYKLVDVGDFVINKMKAWQGSMAVSGYRGIISPAYYICNFIAPVHKRYIHYLLRNETYKAEYMRLSTGLRIGQWDLNIEDFLHIPMIVPPENEQLSIAVFLDKKCSEIDEMISLQERIIEELRAYKQSVITEVVCKGLDHNISMKDSGIEWIGFIPKGWTISSLGSISCGVRNGYVGPTRDLFVPDGVRYLQSLHIKDGKILFDRHEYYVSEEWGEKHPKVHVGDILIVQTGDIGQVGLVEKEYEGCNCHALIILSPQASLVFPQYLTYYLRSTLGKELLLQKKTGALLPHLNSGRIGSVPVILPTIEEQQAISRYLDNKCREIDALISVRQSKIDTFKDYKKSLIYEYVTGKKEVNG